MPTHSEDSIADTRSLLHELGHCSQAVPHVSLLHGPRGDDLVEDRAEEADVITRLCPTLQIDERVHDPVFPACAPGINAPARLRATDKERPSSWWQRLPRAHVVEQSATGASFAC